MPLHEINTRVIIIGAGLTGLTLAYYLKKKGIDFVVVEKDQQPGGVIRSYREKGFVYEAGPNTGVLSNLETGQLFDDLREHCSLEIANGQSKKRLIWKQGKWHCLPSGLREAVTTPLFTPGDKLRILAEPFRSRGKDPMETVAGMVRRRLGQSYLEYAVDPFISGIFAGDPDSLITRYALPRLYSLEQDYGSFIRGAIGRKLWQKGPQPSREVFSVRDGLQNLVHALVKEVGTQNLITGAMHCRTGVAPAGFQLLARVENNSCSINAPFLVPTVGAHALEELFPFFPVGLLHDISSLQYARVVQVVLGFSQWKGARIRAFGGLVPSREQRRILGVLLPSAFLSGRAPQDGMLLNVFMGGARNPQYFGFTDQQILQIVQEEISQMMRLPAFKPELVKIFRYRHAIPQYGKDSARRINAVKQLQQRYPGLILAGNLHEGIGIADRIAQAGRIADMLEQQPETVNQG